MWSSSVSCPRACQRNQVCSDPPHYRNEIEKSKWNEIDPSFVGLLWPNKIAMADVCMSAPWRSISRFKAVKLDRRGVVPACYYAFRWVTNDFFVFQLISWRDELAANEDLSEIIVGWPTAGRHVAVACRQVVSSIFLPRDNYVPRTTSRSTTSQLAHGHDQAK